MAKGILTVLMTFDSNMPLSHGSLCSTRSESCACKVFTSVACFTILKAQWEHSAGMELSAMAVTAWITRGRWRRLVWVHR